MTPMARGMLSNGKLLGSVKSINLNGTTQYLELQGATTRLDIGTSSFGSSFWVKGDSQLYIAYSKGDEASLSGRGEHMSMHKNVDGSIGLAMSVNDSNAAQWSSSSTVPMDGNWHHVYIHRVRGSGDATLPVVRIDNVASVVTQFVNTGSGWDALNFTPPNALTVGALVFNAFIEYGETPAFPGYIIGGALTIPEIAYLYNAGAAVCWPKVATDEPALYAKFTEAFDLGTFYGSTELQALTGKVNGWELSNVNSAPFVNNGLNVSCT